MTWEAVDSAGKAGSLDRWQRWLKRGRFTGENTDAPDRYTEDEMQDKGRWPQFFKPLPVCGCAVCSTAVDQSGVE